MSFVGKAKPEQTAMIRFMFMLGYGFNSWLISRFGFSAGGFSHVAPMLPDGSFIDSRDSPIFAPKGKGWAGFPSMIPAGVRHRPAGYCRMKRFAVIGFPVTPEQAQEWECFLRAEVGREYDRDAIWGFALGRKMHSRKRFICSALAFTSAAFHRVGILQKTHIPSYQVTPDSLYFMFLAIGGRLLARG